MTDWVNDGFLYVQLILLSIMDGATSFNRGILQFVVENAIKYGTVTKENTAAEAVRTFENVRVITNPQSTRVISVMKSGH